MKRSKAPVLLPTLLTLVLFQTTAQEAPEATWKYSYLQGTDLGPEHWGELHQRWAACRNGARQSPINLLASTAVRVPALGELQTSYKPTCAIIKNSGHCIKVTWVGDAGSLNIGGTQYNLTEYHWHSPSEHTFDGHRFDLELHMVHENANHGNAVVGIMYMVDLLPDPFIDMVKDAIQSVATPNMGHREIGLKDPNNIQVLTHSYYRYNGSLTTPGCDESVIWTVIKEVGTASFEQVELLKRAVDKADEMNARPTQAIHGREVDLYEVI